MIDAPLVTAAFAESALVAQSSPFLVRLVYDGPNAANASGRSFKYWQASWSGAGDAVVTWGRIGTPGQSQRKPVAEALDRARSKYRKGYAYDAGTGVARRSFVSSRGLTLAERAARSTRRSTTLEGVLDLAAVHGWVPFDVPEEIDGQVYVDRMAGCWLVGKDVRGEWWYGRLAEAA